MAKKVINLLNEKITSLIGVIILLVGGFLYLFKITNIYSLILLTGVFITALGLTLLLTKKKDLIPNWLNRLIRLYLILVILTGIFGTIPETIQAQKGTFMLFQIMVAVLFILLAIWAFWRFNKIYINQISFVKKEKWLPKWLAVILILCLIYYLVFVWLLDAIIVFMALINLNLALSYQVIAGLIIYGFKGYLLYVTLSYLLKYNLTK